MIFASQKREIQRWQPGVSTWKFFETSAETSLATAAALRPGYEKNAMFGGSKKKWFGIW